MQAKLTPTSIRIGTGSAWWGDRIDPLKRQAELGDLDYLCFEAIGEGTLSTAQVRRRKDPAFLGFDPHLEARLSMVVSGCMARGTRIISNQGWINPIGAAQEAARLLGGWGHQGVKIAAITGSDVLETVLRLNPHILETGAPLSSIADRIVSADAYMGAEPIVDALSGGARLVFTGRVADPSLFLAPMMFEFGWSPLDARLIGAGSGLGHLLECGTQVTGGYYLDPGFKDLSDPHDLAYPIGEVNSDGSAVITKIQGSGGEVSLRTVKEQMFYEVHDPRRYITPDAVVDFTCTQLEELGPSRVRVSGIGGAARTDSIKVSIGLQDGFIGEDMLVLAGPGAVQRALIARDMILRRFEVVKLDAIDYSVDLLGLNAIHGSATSSTATEPAEIALRIAARTTSRVEAEKIGHEIDGMAVSGVGYSGKRMATYERVREVIGIYSALISRQEVRPELYFIES